MRYRIRTLALISLAAVSLACMQPANAEGGSARFRFAPNVYRMEGTRMPKHLGAEPVHTVRNGSVPQGKSFLGLDPTMLAKPAPPAPAPQMRVAATPSFGTAVPVMAAPKTSFNQEFGKPQGAAAPPAQALAPAAPQPQAQVAQAKTLKPAAKSTNPARPVVARSVGSSKKSVSGKLVSRPAPVGNRAVANAGPAVDSYGKNFGYVPGAYLPASGGDGMHTQTDVYGRLIQH